jgi:hypothetical protein
MLEMAAGKQEKTKATADYYLRVGKKSITFWVPEKMPKVLKTIALQEDKSLQDLATEILNDGLAKRGLSRIE